MAIALVLLIAIIAAGYFYWNKWQKAKMTGENAAKGVLPSIGVNPLESKPDINPADKANPFKDIKINPFE